MEFRPPSQRWNVRGESVIPLLAMSSLIGVAASYLFRIPFAADVLLTVTVIAALLVVPFGIPGLVTYACFATTGLAEALRKRSSGQLFREFVVMPALLLLVAFACCTTRWEITAFLFLLVFAWPATLRAADLMATHAVYWFSAQPRIDRTTQIKWRTDWSLRFEGFSSPSPRRKLTADERDEFHDLLDQRLRYRWGRWWLLAV